MAWASDPMWRRRRGGAARRDSNLALIGAVLTGAVLALALLLSLVSRVNPEAGAGLRGAALDAVGPVWSLVSAPLDAMGRGAAGIADHFATTDKLRAERARAARLEAALAAAQARDADRARLAALLNARRPQRRLVVSALASAEGAAAAPRTAVISAGAAEGVRPGMPVIAAAGLAGRVTDVGRNRARVLLLTDPLSRVPVRVQRTGWAGLAVGTGGPLLEFAFDTQSATDRLRSGDRLVSTGDGGLFPPDVPVAVIVDNGSPARARPTAAPLGLGMISVEAPYMPPPVPVPTPAAVPEPDRVPTPPAAGQAAAPAASPAAAPRPIAPGQPASIPASPPAR